MEALAAILSLLLIISSSTSLYYDTKRKDEIRSSKQFIMGNATYKCTITNELREK